MSWVTPPIEWVEAHIKALYRRQERYDNGEHDERKVENALHPRTGQVAVSNRGRAVSSADPMTQGDATP
jgi:hypothetical protein